MTPEERARIIAIEAEESQKFFRSQESLENLIVLHLNDAMRENREAIAKMVETWGDHGQGGYCMDVYPQMAAAIREGKTCIHKWMDIRNKVVESGEMCSRCGALRSGNEATGVAAKPPAWKFRAMDPRQGMNPG